MQRVRKFHDGVAQVSSAFIWLNGSHKFHAGARETLKYI